eukprot:1344191-Pyramimonas_sp.AAC.1
MRAILQVHVTTRKTVFEHVHHIPPSGPLAHACRKHSDALTCLLGVHDPFQITPYGHLSRVGHAHMSKSFQNLHLRHVDTIIVIGMSSIGAVIGLTVVALSSSSPSSLS